MTLNGSAIAMAPNWYLYGHGSPINAVPSCKHSRLILRNLRQFWIWHGHIHTVCAG